MRLFDMRAQRFLPFRKTFIWEGADLSAADYFFQIRTKPDAPGLPLVDAIKTTTRHSNGIYVVGVTTLNSVTKTQLEIFVDEATINALPPAPVLGEPVTLYYGLNYKPMGDLEMPVCQGRFILEPGVVNNG